MTPDSSDLEERVFQLACLGVCPTEIERTLNLPPYNIHKKYHAVLMKGYEQAELNGNAEVKAAKLSPSEYRRLYQEKNKEKVAEYKRLYRQKNKGKIAEYNRLYYQKNKKKLQQHNNEKRNDEQTHD